MAEAFERKPLTSLAQVTEKDINISIYATKNTLAAQPLILRDKPAEVKRIADAKPAGVTRNYFAIAMDFIPGQRLEDGRAEFGTYLRKIHVDDATINALLNDVYNAAYVAYHQNYNKIASEAAARSTYQAEQARKRGDEAEASRYEQDANVTLTAWQSHRQEMNDAGISQKNVYIEAHNSEYGKKLSDDGWRRFASITVKAGFDSRVAGEMLREWGIVPPTLLQVPQLNHIIQMQQFKEDIRRLFDSRMAGKDIDNYLRKYDDEKEQRRIVGLLEKETDNGQFADSMKKAAAANDISTEVLIQNAARTVNALSQEVGIKPELAITVLD